ncbi:MAG: type II secretion system protein [Candidatus Omnitrophota bacterium]|nr:type II secretion system protein [Candidatus Omnitrophota bacterium]
MKKKGFTYTEILITLAVMAALFVPMMQLFSYSLANSSVTGETMAALNLAKWQMERIKNLNYSTEQFKEIGSTYFPPLEEAPLELNGKKLRVFTDIDTGSDPLKVKVCVFYDGKLKDKPIVELITLLVDTTWVKGR